MFAHMQLELKERTSLIEQQLFAVQMIGMCCILLSYAWGKRRNKKEEEEKRTNQNIASDLLNCEKG